MNQAMKEALDAERAGEDPNMSAYRCPSCGTGRWHATGCSEGAPDHMYDEAKRQPGLEVETELLIAQAQLLVESLKDQP